MLTRFLVWAIRFAWWVYCECNKTPEPKDTRQLEAFTAFIKSGKGRLKYQGVVWGDMDSREPILAIIKEFWTQNEGRPMQELEVRFEKTQALPPGICLYDMMRDVHKLSPVAGCRMQLVGWEFARTIPIMDRRAYGWRKSLTS